MNEILFIIISSVVLLSIIIGLLWIVGTDKLDDY
jgi:hypothetical protein